MGQNVSECVFLNLIFISHIRNVFLLESLTHRQYKCILWKCQIMLVDTQCMIVWSLSLSSDHPKDIKYECICVINAKRIHAV